MDELEKVKKELEKDELIRAAAIAEFPVENEVKRLHAAMKQLGFYKGYRHAQRRENLPRCRTCCKISDCPYWVKFAIETGPGPNPDDFGCILHSDYEEKDNGL